MWLSKVTKVTGYLLDGHGSIPDKDKIFLFMSNLVFSHPFFCPVGTRGSFPRISGRTSSTPAGILLHIKCFCPEVLRHLCCKLVTKCCPLHPPPPSKPRFFQIIANLCFNFVSVWRSELNFECFLASSI